MVNKAPMPGDVYAVEFEIQQKWCLYQVILVKEETIAIVALDWFADTLPDKEKLKTLKPLVINHHYWDDRYDAAFVNKNVPDEYKYIGTVPPAKLNESDFHAYANWSSSHHQAARQQKWLSYPEKERTAFKKALKSKDKVIVNDKECRLATTEIYLYDSEGVITWSELDKLPALYVINYQGKDTAIIEYCTKRHMLEKLDWSQHQQKQIDLSRTHIEELIIDVTGLEKLVLPDHTTFLSLTGDLTFLRNLEIVQPLKGKNLKLHIQLKKHPLPLLSLPNLKALSLRVDELDVDFVKKHYPQITLLHVWGSPGFLKNAHALKQLKHLKDIQLQDLFGFTDKDFPSKEDLPQLGRLWLTSIPEDVGKAAKKKFKGIFSLEIIKLRNAAWLEANLDNPFRAWDGREGTSKAKAKKAFDAYKNATTQIEKSKNGKNIDAAQKKIITEFVEVFNALDKKGFVDTLEREEIYDVFNLLQDKMGVKRNQYEKFFDELRNF